VYSSRRVAVDDANVLCGPTNGVSIPKGLTALDAYVRAAVRSHPAIDSTLDRRSTDMTKQEPRELRSPQRC
jgi:hypothetical protein